MKESESRTARWRVVKLSSAIALAEEIRETLERCLQMELNQSTLDSFDKETLSYYDGLAKEDGVPFPEFVKELRGILKNKIDHLIGVANRWSASKSPEDRVFAFLDVSQDLSEFIWDYWNLLPPKVRRELIKEFSKPFQQKNSSRFSWNRITCKLLAVKERVRLLIPSIRVRRNLFALHQEASFQLLNTFYEAIEEDKGEVTQQALLHLSNQIASIPNPTVRKLLEVELQQVETFSDLSSLRETVHIFRSRKNGECLLTALKEADSGVIKPESLESLRQELELGEEGKERRQSVSS